jgi:hypothetical protein
MILFERLDAYGTLWFLSVEELANERVLYILEVVQEPLESLDAREGRLRALLYTGASSLCSSARRLVGGVMLKQRTFRRRRVIH